MVTGGEGTLRAKEANRAVTEGEHTMRRTDGVPWSRALEPLQFHYQCHPHTFN